MPPNTLEILPGKLAGHFFLPPQHVENVIIDSASCKVAWFQSALVVNMEKSRSFIQGRDQKQHLIHIAQFYASKKSIRLTWPLTEGKKILYR